MPKGVYQRPPAVDRFWAAVAKDGPIHPTCGQCWIMTRLLRRDGYGQVRVGKKKVLAHRFSWEVHYGELLPSVCVLHHCDNPPCVNPAHLFLGSKVDNVRDRENKGRGGEKLRRGERNGRAVLTTIKVGEIRMRYDGRNGHALAREFGVNPTTISRIIRGVIWPDDYNALRLLEEWP